MQMAPSRVVPLFQLYPLLLLLPSLLLQTVSSAVTPPPQLPRDFRTYFYNQTLDHFNYERKGYATFRHRFIVNRKYWTGNSTSPIIAYLGSEGPLDVLKAGFVNDNAASLSSLCVFIEHRFYGLSSPSASIQEALNDDSVRGYFNSAQALADYAEIIQYVKRVYQIHDAPVVVVGDSYGGMLAAWFRLKYPHIVLGALASSAPVLYFEKITPQNGFDLIVAKNFKDVSEDCFRSIQNSWDKIDEVASTPDGLSILSQKFNTCAPLNNSDELKGFLESMYEEVAQYDAPPTYPVSLLCKQIDGDSSNQTDILDRISAGVSAYRGNETCQDTNDYDYPSEASIGRNWQMCTELVMPIGSSTGNDTLFQDPSRFKLGLYKRRCRNSYGVQTKPYWVTTYYGGHNIDLVLKRFGSQIIFSNGLKDPMSAGGVLKDISDTIVAITTTNGSNALDMRPAADTDPEWLVKQRSTEVNIIKGWLLTYYADMKALA